MIEFVLGIILGVGATVVAVALCRASKDKKDE